MKWTLKLALAGFVLSQGFLQAGIVHLGVDSSQVSSVSPAGFQTRFKLDNTNWDAMLGNAVQPITSSSILSANLGNTAALSGATHSFRVTNVPGQGIAFQLNPLSNISNVTTLAWGNFSAPFPGGSVSAPTLYSSEAGAQIAPQTSPYNSIHLFAMANALGDQVSFSGAQFTSWLPSGPITNAGTLPTSGAAVNGVSNVFDSYIVYTNDDGTPGDLSSVSWTFFADVTITRTQTGGSEAAKFEFTGKNVTFGTAPPSGETPASVPETSTWLMGVLALGAVLHLMRRRTLRTA